MSGDAKKIVEELVITCRRAYIRGIQTGSGGNMGIGVPGRGLMIMKTSGSSLIDNTPEGFVITDFGENLVEGGRKLAKGTLFHGLLYRICPRVNAVVHTHSPYSIAWVSTGKALKGTTWYARLKISVDSSTLDAPAAMVEEEHPPMMEEIYRENSDLSGFLPVGYGSVAVGRDAVNAEHTAGLIEEAV